MKLPRTPGCRGGDTIADLNDSTAAIDDPNASELDPVFARGYGLATLTVGYNLKLPPEYTVALTLKGGNALNFDTRSTRTLTPGRSGRCRAAPTEVVATLQF